MGIFSVVQREGNLTAERAVHVLLDHLRGIFVTEEEHQFGEHRLGGAVVSAHHAGVLELAARAVAAHLHGAAHALAHIHDNDALVYRLLEQVEEPLLDRRVARPEGLEHYPLQSRNVQYRADGLLRDAGEEFQHHDVGVHQVVGTQRFVGDAGDLVLVVVDVHAHLGQRRVVGRHEGVEALGTDFGGAVAAQQVVAEEDTHLGYQRFAGAVFGGGYFDGGDEVFLTVGAQHADGQLRAGEDDGLVEVLEHEAQGRCRVGHCVGTVQHDKAVEQVVVVGDDVHEFHPRTGFDFRRVDGGLELYGRDGESELSQLGDLVEEMVKVERFETSRLAVLYHSDGTTGVNDKNRCYIFRHTQWFYKVKQACAAMSRRRCRFAPEPPVWLYKNNHLRKKITFCRAKTLCLFVRAIVSWQKDNFKMPFKNPLKI